MEMEKYLAIAGIGLFFMFSAEVSTFYIYLADPLYDVEPTPRLLMYIAIGAAPAMCVTGTAFLLAKKYGSRGVGMLIIGGGLVLFGGMYYATTLVSQIDRNYMVFEIDVIPPLFMAVSFPIIGIGALLFRTRPRPAKEFF